MLGYRLRTSHTLDSGLYVKHLLVAEAVPYKQKWYVALTIDRETYSPVVVVSQEGESSIEQSTKENLSQAQIFHFSLSSGITPELLDRMAERLELSPEMSRKFGDILQGLFAIFKDKDASLLEVNSLVCSADGNLTCSDAKFTFDDAAHTRQKELFSLRDKSHEVQEEVEAERYGLIYVRMEGNIGNVVNGAGLAMATNDAIHLYGGASANFLDAGGQATKGTMQQAFRIVLMDTRVKAILVNVYGGKYESFVSCAMRS